MIEVIRTSIPEGEVLLRARGFFSERAPHYGAYLEQESARHLTFRGKGGEEIAISVRAEDGGTSVRASSPSYGQAISRFFATLPRISGEAAE